MRDRLGRQLRLESLEQRTLLSVWHVDDGSFVQLGTDLMNDQDVVGGGRYATESTDAPYAWEVMFGRQWSDVYLVDVADGSRERVIEILPAGRSLMPEGLLDDLSDEQLRGLFAYLRISQPIAK